MRPVVTLAFSFVDNLRYLKQIEGRAIEDKKAYESTFRNWASLSDLSAVVPASAHHTHVQFIG